MRALSAGMQAALTGGATTLARCWKLTRNDAVVLGFTDHDQDISFDGVTFAALSGVEGSQMDADYGFAIGGGEIAGALASEGLAEHDLARGVWDNAAVAVFLVDWRNVANRVLLAQGALGEIRRRGQAFTAELRSLSHRLDEERGRVYSASCTAVLGDARCGMDMALPQWRAQGVVLTTVDAAIFDAAASAHADRWFASGRVQWLSGGNAGTTQSMSDHRIEAARMRITMASPPFAQVMPGDAFTLIAGCDKQFKTCRERFANVANFRGFPHMPGNDHVVTVAREGDARLDGGSLFR